MQEENETFPGLINFHLYYMEKSMAPKNPI